MSAFIFFIALASPQGDFSQANAHYQNRDFARAAEAYQALITANRPTADLYYNHGVALALDGRIPDAMASFRRALSIEVAHPQAQTQLQYFRQKLPDPITAAEPSWAEKILLFVVWMMDQASAYWLALILALICIPLVLSQDKRALRLSNVFGILSILILGLSYLRPNIRGQLAIAKNDCTLMLTPNEGAVELGEILLGSEFKLKEERESYVWVEHPRFGMGWLNKDSALLTRR